MNPLAVSNLKFIRLLSCWARTAASRCWRSNALLTAMSTIYQNTPRYHQWDFAGVRYRAIIISGKSTTAMWVFYSDTILWHGTPIFLFSILHVCVHIFLQYQLYSSNHYLNSLVPLFSCLFWFALSSASSLELPFKSPLLSSSTCPSV